MRESFILPRVTLAVTKRHFWVCHTRQMCSWYLCRDKNLRQFARTIYQFNIPVTDDMFNVVDISESEFSLLGSLCSLLLQFCQETSFTWSSVRNLLLATTFWIFPVVFCYAFCMWHWPSCKNFGFEFHLRSLQSSGWPLGQPSTSFLATLCWRHPTRSKQLSSLDSIMSLPR